MNPQKPRVLSSRKILIASLGVATVSYACSSSTTSGNLMPPTETGGAAGHAGTSPGGFTSGNLMPPPPSGGAGGTVNTGGTRNSGGGVIAIGGFTSGNLMAPPPTGGAGGALVDASKDSK